MVGSGGFGEGCARVGAGLFVKKDGGVVEVVYWLVFVMVGGWVIH